MSTPPQPERIAWSCCLWCLQEIWIQDDGREVGHYVPADIPCHYRNDSVCLGPPRTPSRPDLAVELLRTALENHTIADSCPGRERRTVSVTLTAHQARRFKAST